MTAIGIHAVVFDLDGLLVDSEPLQIQAWEQFLARHGHTLAPELLADMFGLRIWDSARLVIDRLGLPLTMEDIIAERDTQFLASIPGNLRPMHGAITLIDRLRNAGVTLGLATSGHRRYVDIVLDELGLVGMFDAEVTGGEVDHGKPAPDIYLAAASQLGLPPAVCVALEDAPHGIAAAKAAGMRCLAVPNEMTVNLPGFELANATLPSLAEALAWLEAHGLDSGRQ